jgi:Asp-tRNA(Asn)/Glu-tRNA(Gln) amidotransferase A subunit family amidase
MPVPTNFLSATATIALAVADEVTVTDIVTDHISRLEERDPAIRAWSYFDKDHVLAEATRLDAIPKDRRGPLHGAIIGVKDIISTQSFALVKGSSTC